MTHACCLDMIVDLRKELLILLGILAPDQDVQRVFASFQLFEMLRYVKYQLRRNLAGVVGGMAYLSSQL